MLGCLSHGKSIDEEECLDHVISPVAQTGSQGYHHSVSPRTADHDVVKAVIKPQTDTRPTPVCPYRRIVTQT
jgi:hypothetical protein